MLNVPSARLFRLDKQGGKVGLICAEWIAQVARLRLHEIGFAPIPARETIEVPDRVAVNFAGDCFDCLAASENGSAGSDCYCFCFECGFHFV